MQHRDVKIHFGNLSHIHCNLYEFNSADKDLKRRKDSLTATMGVAALILTFLCLMKSRVTVFQSEKVVLLFGIDYFFPVNSYPACGAFYCILQLLLMQKILFSYCTVHD